MELLVKFSTILFILLSSILIVAKNSISASTDTTIIKTTTRSASTSSNPNDTDVEELRKNARTYLTEYLKISVNTSREPCDNFFEYVCENGIVENKKMGVEGIVEYLQKSTLTLIAGAIIANDTTIQRRNNIAYELARKIYIRCIKDEKIISKEKELYCVELLPSALSDFVYVSEIPLSYRKAAREQAQHLMHYIFAGLRSMFDQVAWLKGATKRKALLKIDKMTVNLLHAKQHESFETFSEYYKELLDQVKNVTDLEKVVELFWTFASRESDKALKNRQRDYFTLKASDINAEFSFTGNSINIPLAIIQPPFFVPYGPIEWNFGSLGSIIGHELSHAFDVSGVKYDENGRQIDWMDKKGAKKFSEASECIHQQYIDICGQLYGNDEICPSGDGAVSENMADNAGIHAALRGLEHFIDTEPSHDHINFPFDNLTDTQLFFFAFTQTWCSPRVPFFLDEHASPHERVLGTLQNQPAFGNAFECTRDCAYAPQSGHCQIWVAPMRHRAYHHPI